VSTAAFEPGTALTIQLESHAEDVATARHELDPHEHDRVPLHITLIHPFVPRRDVTPDLLSRLRSFFGDRPGPTFDLARVDEFPGDIAYVAPDPDGPLIELIEELAGAYPETPPYGGSFGDIVPHVTIAGLDVVDIGRVRARVAPLLPVRCRPDHASLVEEYQPDRWREWHGLPFAGAS
jgi:2'-5' RNA ligase